MDRARAKQITIVIIIFNLSPRKGIGQGSRDKLLIPLDYSLFE